MVTKDVLDSNLEKWHLATDGRVAGMGQVTDEKVTVQVAAKALGVHEKSVHRYIAKGLLTRIRDGNRTYVPLAQVVHLRNEQKQSGQGQVTDKIEGVPKDGNKVSVTKTATVTIDRDHYEGILIRIGQLEAENKTLKNENQKLIEDMKFRDHPAAAPPEESPQEEQKTTSFIHAPTAFHMDEPMVPPKRPWWRFWEK